MFSSYHHHLSRSLLALLALFSLAPAVAVAACDDSLPPTGSRDDILVIVNDNSIDSCAVAVHYAQKRGLGRNNLVHIKAPASYFLSWSEFKIMRDQLIRHMRANTFQDPAVVPVDCPTGNESPVYCQQSMDQLRTQTRIRYLVTTRGVPSRTTVDGSSLSSPGAPTSVDNYLRHWLVNYYASDVSFDSSSRARAFEDGRGMRTVDPATDGELIVGRIDGLDAASAKALVDRALAAEANGLYGKHYGSRFGSTGGQAVWRDYAGNRYVYGDHLSGWGYQHGLFGNLQDSLDPSADAVRFVQDNNCLTHLDNPAYRPEGKSPQNCVVKLTNGVDAPPGRPASRQPLVDNALVYLGSLDGQPTNGSFAGFMNWRRNTTCSVTLCKDSADPAACRLASTDALGEINTACAGVAEGFIGYNFQSFPVSYLAVWPTGWYQTTANREVHWGHQGGGDINNLAFPEVVQGDSADGDGYSVWFRNTDEIASPQCYTDLSLGTTAPCKSDRRILSFVNATTFATRSSDPAAPDRYRIALKIKATDLDRLIQLRVGILVKEPDYGFFQVYHGVRNFRRVGDTLDYKLPVGNSDWVEVEAFFDLDPARHATARSNCQNDTSNARKKCYQRVSADFLATPWSGTYDGIKIRLETTANFVGAIGLDDVRIEKVADGTAIAMRNPSFTEGHEQVAAGDHAANFLSRLNGTAFWGSVSHHQSGGHSFDNHPQETLIYFMRGLPLGDAVWFAERYNSGMLYGDPIYSPIAVRFHYLNQYDFVINGTSLYADTVNGTDANRVSTSFSVEYCPGADFFVCDQTGNWQATGLAGRGGRRGTLLGSWNSTGISAGQYTLRLSVTSTNSATGKTQTFHDYYPVIVTTDTSDFDNDGLTDYDEVEIYATDPTVADSDGDGLIDGDEIAIGTDPNKADTDADGMTDGWEAQYPGLDPLSNDAAGDLDSDGLSNLDEFTRKTDPANPDSDADGLTDGEEVNTYGTRPLRPDTDRDRVNDGLEVSKGTDPLSNVDQDLDGMSNDWETIYVTSLYVDDSARDPDGDGVDNVIEYLRGTLPNDATSTQLITTWYVDGSTGDNANDGSKTSPFATINKAIQSARHGDTIEVAAGLYNMNNLSPNKSVKIQGPRDRSARLVTNFTFINGVVWGGLANFQWTSQGGAYLYSSRNVTLRNMQITLSRPFNLNPNTKLILDHALITGTAVAGITATPVATGNRTSLYLFNTTLAGFPTGIRWNSSFYLRINNSILANTVDVENAYGFQFWYTLSSDGTYTAFSGNLTGDPRFVDAAKGDYHLLPTSPAIDTGNPHLNAGNEPAGHRLNLGFYGNTAEAATAADSDGDGMPDGWEIVMGLDPLLADHQVDSDGDAVVNALEYKAATRPLVANSRRGLQYQLLNPNLVGGSVEIMALVDSSYLFGPRYLTLNQFELASLDTSTLKQGTRLYANQPLSMASKANGTDMPAVDWMAGHDFVVPHFRLNHSYYLSSPYGKATVTVTTDTTRTFTINRGQVITVDGGSLNTLSAIIRSDLPIMVSHGARFSATSSLVDTYVVPPASKEVLGILSRYVTLGALEDNTSITIYKGDGRSQSMVLNAGGRYVINGDSTTAQGQGMALRIVADKPVAAIQGADSDGVEATAFWDPLYFGRRYGLPVDTQYVALACRQSASIGLYDNTGTLVASQTCTPTGNTPGKAYFSQTANGTHFTAGHYLISDQPVYLIFEASGSNDEKNLLGRL